jgi:hypothetical protein
MCPHIVVACFKQGKTIWLYKCRGILWLAEQLLASEGKTLLIVVVGGYQHFRVTCSLNHLPRIYLPQTLVSTWQTTSYLSCHKTMWHESTPLWEYQILCQWHSCILLYRTLRVPAAYVVFGLGWTWSASKGILRKRSHGSIFERAGNFFLYPCVFFFWLAEAKELPLEWAKVHMYLTVW